MREQGLSNYEIADQLGVDEASVRRGLRKAGYKPYLVPNKMIQRMAVELEQALRIDVKESGAGAVTADWHLPLADFQLINTFIDHARDVGATNWLLVAGDWFNIDALSSFDFKQETAGLPKEIEASTETMDRLLETFQSVTLSWGNHDARVHKALGYKVPFATAMRLMFADLDPEKVARIRFTNLDHVYIDTPRGPYYVAHPKSYNQHPLTSARKIATIQHAHVITGHSHHTALGHDPSGRFVVAEIGGFFDASKTGYLQRTTTYPKWQNGWGFIDRDGYLSVEGEGWSSRIGRRA
jgi:hypothetical protein